MPETTIWAASYRELKMEVRAARKVVCPPGAESIFLSLQAGDAVTIAPRALGGYVYGTTGRAGMPKAEKVPGWTPNNSRSGWVLLSALMVKRLPEQPRQGERGWAAPVMRVVGNHPASDERAFSLTNGESLNIVPDNRDPSRVLAINSEGL